MTICEQVPHLQHVSLTSAPHHPAWPCRGSGKGPKELEDKHAHSRTPNHATLTAWSPSKTSLPNPHNRVPIACSTLHDPRVAATCHLRRVCTLVYDTVLPPTVTLLVTCSSWSPTSENVSTPLPAYGPSQRSRSTGKLLTLPPPPSPQPLPVLVPVLPRAGAAVLPGADEG